MAVVIETTLGDITVDLYLEQRPATCLNFLKLCKMKYYNFNLFHTIRSGFIAQTGDPTGEGSGGESIWGLLEGSSKRFFSGEKMPKIRHTDAGLLSMVCTDNMMVGSQFFFTLAPDLDSLDGVHCVIGEVTEGHEVLTKLNEVICDETHRPYQDVRITHTVVLEDPFNDLPGLRLPSRSPSPNAERLKGGRIAPDEEIDETQGKSHEEIQEMIEEKEAKARATILEIVGDLPDADIAPPENVLFVCKLNPVTTDDDLEIIFSRFGKIVSCEVIRDKKTGDSLQYAFIEFEDKKSCEDAYFKMDNVLIDDRRIHVDFSQSVSKMRWLGKGRGVQYFNDKDIKPPEVVNNRSKKSHSRERNEKRQHYRDRENRDKDNSYRNEKKSLHRERDRSRTRSRREISKSSHSKHEHSRSDKNHSQENNSNHNKDDYSHKHIYDKRQDNNYDKRQDNNYDKRQDKNYDKGQDKNYDKRQDKNYDKRQDKNYDKQEHTLNNRKEHSRSPVKEQKNKDEQDKYKRNRSNDRHKSNSHITSKRDDRNEPPSKKLKHSLNSSSKSEIQKESSRSNSKDVSEKRVHTPSPASPQVEKNSKSKNKDKVKTQKKLKDQVRKNKKRRKPLTSSESDTSDSSSSSSESSSSSDRHKKKRALKRRKRRHSSSSSSSTSSTTSTDSTSTSSSSSNSSGSSSDSDDRKKKRIKRSNKKSGKKTKKL